MITLPAAVTAIALNLHIVLAGLNPAPAPSPAAAQAVRPTQTTYEQPGLTKRALTAAGEVAFINFGVWAALQYGGGAFYSYISAETIGDNIRDGWEWDRSMYCVNFYHHPYHGYLYYGAGRANGLGYWGSSLAALGGSFMWEMAMEKYRPSINDLITTSTGGIVLGEVGYRFSAMVRKRNARGVSRIMREAVGALLDPVGGVNRLFNGHKDNEPGMPGAPDEGRILDGDLILAGPVVSRSSGFTVGRAAPTLGFRLDYGGADGAGWGGKPFDMFSVRGLLRWGPDRPHLSLFINGALFGRTFAGSGGAAHFVGLFQHYEYYGIDTMRVCGTSFTAGWSARFVLGPAARLTAAARLGWLGLGSSDDFYGQPADRRGYNMTTGITGAAEVRVAAKGFEVLSLSWRHYRLFDLDVVGSRPGREAWDILVGQAAIPILADVGIGMSAEYCVRRFDFRDFDPGARRLFEARAFITWRF